jgi:hypothetical protein
MAGNGVQPTGQYFLPLRKGSPGGSMYGLFGKPLPCWYKWGGGVDFAARSTVGESDKEAQFSLVTDEVTAF